MRRLSLRIDNELGRAIDAYAEANGLNQSQATRELLRQILTDAESVDRGWREGFTAGYAEVAESLNRAAAEAAG